MIIARTVDDPPSGMHSVSLDNVQAGVRLVFEPKPLARTSCGGKLR